MIGLVAILKAGGVYIPLDPEYPAERLEYMMAAGRLALTLTNSLLAKRLPLAADGHCILLDELDTSGEPDTPPPLRIHPEQLVYLIFTSGSTGKPKGVAITHRGLHNHLAWLQDTYQLASNDTVLQKSPLSFDVSVREFLWPLITGARLVIAQPGAHRDPANLIDLIRQHDVTTVHFVPSMLQAFIAHPSAAACRTIRRLICGGEALSSGMLTEVSKRLPNVLVAHQYGATETAINATYWICGVNHSSGVPIGQPIWNTRVYVLDAELKPVPAGVAGELYIAGAGLARGYLNRPELTAEQFVADPFGIAGRMYRTGDVVRWLPEGVLEFLGRVDNQVKIRGFRVELGEIEAELSRYCGVAQCAVTAREDRPGDKRLVAYVVTARGGQLDSGTLRAYLDQKLPYYMVPSSFVRLQTLPLTPSGKVDRKALPAPQRGEPDQKPTWAPARTPTEEILASIWEDALALERVGIHDDFFQLGGNSLLALQILQEMSSTFGIELPVRLFFTAPTVFAHAKEIERARAANQNNRPTYGTLVPFRTGGSEPPFFLVPGGFAGEAELLVYARLACFLNRRQPFYALRTRCVDELEEPLETVEMMAAEHLSDIRRFQPQGPYFIGGACAGGVVALEMAHQLHGQGEVVAL